MTTWYMDYENGTDANAGAGAGDSFATRRKKIDNFVAAAIAPGDTIRIMGSAPATSLAVNTAWSNLEPNLALFGTTDTLITDCETNWTQKSNVTCTLVADPVVGTYCEQIAVASAFTTGLAAYFDLGSNQDYSARQVLVFYFKQTAGTVGSAGDISIKLCSDAVGAVAVNTFTTVVIPVRQLNDWVRVAIDLGSAAGAAIRSIGFYVNVDRGAQTFRLDDIRIATSGTLNADICTCESAWTASANVTTTTSSDRKEGTLSASIAPQAAFTTGLAAYFATGTLDLSGYQQVSFWIKQTAGTVNVTGDITITLCTNNDGTGAVHTIDPGGLAALNQWTPILWNNAGNLNAAIKSIALNVVTDRGAVTFLIDNVIAVKADGNDSLSLRSLIGKPNSTGAGGNDTETWYAIRAIRTSTVVLDTGPNDSNATQSRGYSGTAETVTGYKRETIKTGPQTSGQNVQTVQDFGTAGNLITFSGGWNRTDMTTQTLETWFDGVNGLGNGLVNAQNYTAISKLNFVRYANALSAPSGGNCTWTSIACNNNGGNAITNVSGASCTWTSITANNNTSNGLSSVSGNNCTWTTVAANNNNITGLSSVSGNNCTWTTVATNNNASGGIASPSGNNCTWTTVTANSNGSTALSSISGNNCTWTTVVANSNGSSGIGSFTGTNCTWIGVSTSGNTTSGFAVAGSVMTCLKSTFSDTTPFSSFTSFADGRVISFDDGNVNGAFKISCDGGTVQVDSTTVHTGGGKSWKFSPTSVNRSSTYKLTNVLARIPVVANTTYTVRCWVYRDNVTNLNAGLLVKGGYIAGVANDVTVTASGSINTWAQETLADFTPTENGVVELYGQVWDGTGTTNNAYFDDVTVNGISITLDRPDWRFGPGPDPLASGSSGMLYHTGGG